jgi:hypothetical protein
LKIGLRFCTIRANHHPSRTTIPGMNGYGGAVKFVFVLVLALGATIAWQTSVRPDEENTPAIKKAVEEIQQENQQAGRVSFPQTECGRLPAVGVHNTGPRGAFSLGRGRARLQSVRY